MRLLGLDYGDRTIGVAVSDSLGLIAQAVEVIRRKDEISINKSIKRLAELIEQYDVSGMVLGYPRNMDNTEGERCEKTQIFKKKLEKHFPNIDIILWDERMSTLGAQRSLIEANLSEQKRAKIIDKMAAVFILQGYLDQKNR